LGHQRQARESSTDRPDNGVGCATRAPPTRIANEPSLAAINIAQDLAALRVSRGLSQTQLAAQLGITKSAIAQLETAQPENVELRTLVRGRGDRCPGGSVHPDGVRPDPSAKRSTRASRDEGTRLANARPRTRTVAARPRPSFNPIDRCRRYDRGEFPDHLGVVLLEESADRRVADGKESSSPHDMVVWS
jgi:hypothetical protein